MAVKTLDELHALIAEHEDEYLKYELCTRKYSTSPDINAFVLLGELITRSEGEPFTKDIIQGAEHDEIYLAGDVEKILTVATEEELLDLYRCGVRVGEYDCFEMFV